MNMFSKALARDHMAVMDTALTPAAQEMRTAFNNWATATGIDLETAQALAENDRQNVVKLHRIIGNLPGVVTIAFGCPEVQVVDKDPYRLVAAQASMVFHTPAIPALAASDGPVEWQSDFPYYVIGMDTDDQSLLLAASHRLQIKDATVSASKLPAVLYKARATGRPLETLSLFSNSIRPFRLPSTRYGRYKRLGQIHKHLQSTSHIDALVKNEAAQQQLYNLEWDQFSFNIGSVGSLTLAHYDVPEIMTHVSDAELSRYNVVDNLVRLTTAFPDLQPGKTLTDPDSSEEIGS